MAYLVIEKGNECGKVFEVGDASVVIGNPAPGSRPDIPLIDEYVSRRHAEIKFTGEAFSICDLGSKNGTEINGKRINPGESYQLKDNQAIDIAVISGEARFRLRFKISIGTKGPPGAVVPDWIQVDQDRHEVYVDGKEIPLTRSEYELMLLLYKRVNTICSRDDIIRAVSKWSGSEDPSAVTNEQVDIMVHRLRKKIEPGASRPTRIISRRNFGYMLVNNP